MSKRIPKIEVFRAKDGGYCWRYIAVNGEEIFRASETYKSEATMKKVMYEHLGHAGHIALCNWEFVDLTTTRPLKKKPSTGTITDKRRRPTPTTPTGPTRKKK